MADPNASTNHLKKETVLLVVAACLPIVFSVFKFDNGAGTVTTTQQQPPAVNR